MAQAEEERGTQLPETIEPVTDSEQIGLLRAAAYLNPDNPTDLALGYILAATRGDVGLAADAIHQEPRPMWVGEFFGPGLGMGFGRAHGYSVAARELRRMFDAS